MTKKSEKSTSRRKFLLAAGAAGAATVAMPQVSRAQTVTWKYQSTWPTKDIFHEFAADYAKKVNDMSGGRLRLDVLAAGAVVPFTRTWVSVGAGTSVTVTARRWSLLCPNWSVARTTTV